MGYSSYDAASWNGEHHWRYHRPFSPFGLLFGVAMLALLFKTGLWLPLVGIGFAFFLFSQMGGGPWRRGMRGGPFGRPGIHGGMRGGPFARPGMHRHGHRWHGPHGRHDGDEKPKRGFGPFDGAPWYGPTEPDAEKPKRDLSDDEYV